MIFSEVSHNFGNGGIGKVGFALFIMFGPLFKALRDPLTYTSL